MSKLCRQVSIESPDVSRNCVFNFIVPVPETPPNGARIQIVFAGACYRPKAPSFSMSIEQSDPIPAPSPAIREGAIFPGYEVAGKIEALGSNVSTSDFFIGQRVIIYPFENLPAGYAELIVVPDIKYLVPVPDKLPLEIAAMLPTGALIAMNAILRACDILKNRGDGCKLLVVGTGGLALWAVRLAAYYFTSKVDLTVAVLRDEGFLLTKDMENVKTVQWNEAIYEPQLIERTINICEGKVDVVVDFGSTNRSLHRSIRCLNENGVVLINEEIAERTLLKFKKLSQENKAEILTISPGSIEQLRELVNLIADQKIDPPPHSIYPYEEAAEVVKKLCASQIAGRAILRFQDLETNQISC